MKSLLSVSVLALTVGAGLLACGGKTPTAQSLPTPPAINSFLADNSQLAAGESTRLHFEAANATEAELVDQNGVAIPFEGSASSGDATVSPEHSSFYVLRVKGEGGADTAFVQIAVGEKLKDIFLVAVPSEVEPGQSSELLWSAFNSRNLRIQTSEGERIDLDAEAGSGVVEVKPTRTTTYELFAGPLDPKLATTASTTVAVQPKLDSISVTPPAGKSGDVLTLSWESRGGEELTIAEATFGQIAHLTAPNDLKSIDSGSVQWTVPAQTPAGENVMEGRPLQFTFTLHQSTPEVTITRSYDTYVGTPPQIVDFRVPPAVTQGKTFDISWKTKNAAKLQIYADGGLVYEPLALEPQKLVQGKLTLQAPLQDTTFELVITGAGGTVVRQQRLVQSVKLPVISAFNISTPVAKPGDSARVTFGVQNAAYLFIRAKNGPNAFYTSDPKVMVQGQTTLYPGASGFYVLEAYNLAGDLATAETFVTVSTPDGWNVTPTPTLTGSPVTVNWSVNTLTTAQLIGDPGEPPVKNNPAYDWYELDGHVDARPVVFNEGDEAVAKLPLLIPFRFPFVGSTFEDFYVSTNGFVTFQDKGALPENKELDSTTDPLPTMIAPFWDDLKLGPNGKVQYLVEGDHFPRRLIVQWSHVQTAADEHSDLTFQLQLWETGEFHFGYRSLAGNDSAGQKASIGWRVNDTLAYEANVGGAIVGSGDELLWFASGALAGSYQVRADAAGVFAVFARLANGQHVIYPQYVNAVPEGAILVNEFMPVGDVSTTNGQWLELTNVTDKPIELGGIEIASESSQTSYVFPPGPVLQPGEYFVVGGSTDPVENGGAHVDLAWTDITPETSADDALVIKAGDGEVSRFAYTTADILPGTSIMAPDKAIDGAGQGITCNRTVTFGSNGALGTPGARNETCFEYWLDPIAEKWDEIKNTGTSIYDINQSYFPYPYVVAVDISSAPFKYFGTEYPKLWINGAYGVMSFANMNNYYTIKTKPTASDPIGTIAPFWTYLYNASPGETGIFWQRRVAGVDPGVTTSHWVIEWYKVTHTSWPSSAYEDLNYEVKLFDDGVIEFHYDEMIDGTNGNVAHGEQSTIWIERPAGDGALPVGIKEPSVKPHSAFRFTPKP